MSNHLLVGTFCPFPAAIINFKVVLLCLTLLVLSWLVSPGMQGIQTPPENYKFLRVEACQGLVDMFERIEKGEVAKSDIRNIAGQTLTREIREVLERQHEEGALQQSSQTHGNNRRKWPTAVQRKLVFDGLNLCPLIKWCSKAGNNAYSIRLSPGEPSRLAYEAIHITINWSLYIYSKFAAERESKLQVYPDRGPKQRAAKGKGKGKGKGKKGGEKGKGKGKRNQDNQEG